jgi:hypothetical protein
MKKTLLPIAVLAFPMLASAMVQVIPKAELDLKAIQNQKTYVLKNAKGTFLQKSILEQLTGLTLLLLKVQRVLGLS